MSCATFRGLMAKQTAIKLRVEVGTDLHGHHRRLRSRWGPRS